MGGETTGSGSRRTSSPRRFLNPRSWTGDIRGLSHDEINANIVVINPPHRPVRSKTREGDRIRELKLLPSSRTETAYIELAARAVEMLAWVFRGCGTRIPGMWNTDFGEVERSSERSDVERSVPPIRFAMGT